MRGLARSPRLPCPSDNAGPAESRIRFRICQIPVTCPPAGLAISGLLQPSKFVPVFVAGAVEHRRRGQGFPASGPVGSVLGLNPCHQRIKGMGISVQTVKSTALIPGRLIRFQEIWPGEPTVRTREHTPSVSRRQHTANFVKSETQGSHLVSRIREIQAPAFGRFWLPFFSALCFKSENKSKAWW